MADAEWRSFFAEMEAARDVMLRTCGLPLDELVADYAFLRIGDLISLAFCTGSSVELRYGGWTVQLSGTRVEVTPELFGEAVIPIAQAIVVALTPDARTSGGPRARPRRRARARRCGAA